MNILITGAAGYIGSWYITRFIGPLCNVVGFDNLRYDQGPVVYHLLDGLHIEDVNNWSHNLKREIKKADIIIPLAALVGAPLCDKFPEEATRTNRDWIKRLTKELSKDQLVLLANTNSGYGSVPNGVCTEETPSNPISLYGKTKQEAEDILLNEHPNSIVYRLATVFGVSVRPRLDLLVNSMVLEAHKTKNINVFDGHFRRNYVHISDVCSGLNWAIYHQDKMRGNVYNLGDDSINMTKMELAQTIANLTDSTVTEIRGPVDNDKRDYMVSSEKLKNVGFSAMYGLEHGIEELMNYYAFLPKTDLPFLRNY